MRYLCTSVTTKTNQTADVEEHLRIYQKGRLSVQIFLQINTIYSALLVIKTVSTTKSTSWVDINVGVPSEKCRVMRMMHHKKSSTMKSYSINREDFGDKNHSSLWFSLILIEKADICASRGKKSKLQSCNTIFCIILRKPLMKRGRRDGTNRLAQKINFKNVLQVVGWWLKKVKFHSTHILFEAEVLWALGVFLDLGVSSHGQKQLGTWSPVPL